MFKVSYNRAVLRYRLHTVTPLSIRAGDAGLDPAAADLACVRTHHRRHGPTVYIPGSSLRGVLRAAAEASVRGRRFRLPSGTVIDGACDPGNHETSCARHGKRTHGKKDDTAEVHRSNCVACRLFGSLSIRGRCAIRDLFPFSEATELTDDERTNLERANRVEVRHGVLISRISGSVDVGPFDQEMVPAGVCFHGEIALQNYQVWQLGLLFGAFDELEQGFAQLGSSKSRGLGVVRVEFDSLVHEQRAGAEDRPLGAGALMDPSTWREYGLLTEGELPELSGDPRGLAVRFEDRGTDSMSRWQQRGMTALHAILQASQGGEA